MRPHTKTRSVGRVLWASLRWLPLLAFPFSVLFAEVWLELHILENNYLTVRLRQDTETLQNTIMNLKAERARLEDMHRLEVRAQELGLIEPHSYQIEVVSIDFDAPPEPQNPVDSITYAHRGQQRPSEPPARDTAPIPAGPPSEVRP